MGTCAASASRAVASATSLEIKPPIATTWFCCVSFLKPSMPAFGVDWSSATKSLSFRPLTPPLLLISLTANRIPSRVWMPQGVKFPVSEVSAPIAMGLLLLDPLDAFAPSTAASNPTAPTTATNHNRFMDPSISRGRRRPALSSCLTG
jgi:hypothetical protein